MILSKNIILPPHLFNQEYKKSVFVILSKQYTGSCSIQYGKIISIDEILKINNGLCTSEHGTHGAMFTVEFKCTTFNPKVNDILDGTIFSISLMGILIKNDHLNSFIPSSTYQDDFVFSSSESDEDYGVLINSKTKKVLKKDDLITFKLTCIKISPRSIDSNSLIFQ
ncbi:MAG: hypothetical protein OEL89_05480 [Candidatus Peregrinibacteria bacterium]|nr:hypothetical protein [Candidatus Peregrinibacteria bacterium]